MTRVLLSVGLASVLASLAVSGGAGAESRSSQASIRLTGVIEMRANGSTLTFFSRSQIDTTLRSGAAVDPVSVPMEYEWKGVLDSCSFAAAGTDGEMHLQVFAVGNDGRPSLSIYGSPPTVKSSDCNYFASPTWTVGLHRVQSGVSQRITSVFSWSSTGNPPGTGTVALTCGGCAGAGSAETAKVRPRVLWFYDNDWTPDGYKGGGETVRFKVKRVAVVHNGIATGKVASGRCEVFYTRGHTGALLKRLLVPGKWTLPSPRANEGSLTCIWKRPKGLFGLWEGVNPGVRYQGTWYHMSKKAYKGAMFRRQLLR